MSIDLQAVREAGNLITMDEAREVLSTTEPMTETQFALDGTDRVGFTLPMGWQDDLQKADGSTVTSTGITVNGAGFNLTKEALLKMTSSIGLTKDYVMRSPGPLIAPQLNWWVKNGGVKGSDGMRLLSKDNVGIAFIKSSLATFANLPMLDRVEQMLRAKFGEQNLYVDYKIAHSLERTALRIIVPDADRLIPSARNSAGEEDRWSLGVQLTNSLMGDPETRLAVNGYLFAWWCTNGAVSTHATSGNYNRRVQGQDFAEVLDWIGTSTERIMTDLEPELDDIAALTTIPLDGELNDVVADLFNQLHVPVPARKGIVDALVESDDLSAYGLMQAVTQAANDPTLSDRVRETTMRVGGLIPHTITDRCDSCHRVQLS
jgi:hypothetical protein